LDIHHKCFFLSLSLAHTQPSQLFTFYLFIPSAITLYYFYLVFVCFSVFGYFIPLPIDDPFPHLFEMREALVVIGSVLLGYNLLAGYLGEQGK
jgi:hypothetical protein